MTDMKVNLADQLLLLVHDESGTLRVSAEALSYGLAGGLLMELMLAQRVAVPEQRVVVTDPGPTGDPLVDQALGRISADRRGRKPKDWISPLSKGLREQTLDRLVQAGVLRRDRQKLLGIFPRTRYPSATGGEPVPAVEARQRLRAALDASGPIDPRTAALAALVRAVSAEALAVPERPKREVRAQLKVVVEASWPADAVRKAINEMEAALAAAVTTATVAATTTTST